MAIQDKEILGKVAVVIDQLRPFLEADGGNMELIEISDDFVVKVRMIGACSSCSMSPMTLKAGLEENLKIVLPQIKGVEAVNEQYV
jgi:Fe-S cluster biogenesis protein NfuA